MGGEDNIVNFIFNLIKSISSQNFKFLIFLSLFNLNNLQLKDYEN